MKSYANVSDFAQIFYDLVNCKPHKSLLTFSVFILKVNVIHKFELFAEISRSSELTNCIKKAPDFSEAFLGAGSIEISNRFIEDFYMSIACAF